MRYNIDSRRKGKKSGTIERKRKPAGVVNCKDNEGREKTRTSAWEKKRVTGK